MVLITGFSLVLPLVLFSAVILYVAKILPPQAVLGSILFMFVGDAILAALWYYGVGESVEDMSLIKMGCGLAFATTTVVRALYFAVKGNLITKI